MSKASSIPERSIASRYSVAVCATLGVTLIRWLLDPLLGRDQPMLLFTLAITLAGWWGGFGPGILATLFSAVIATWAFIEPIYSFEVTEPGDITRISILVLIGVSISLIAESMHRAMRKSRDRENSLRSSTQRLDALAASASLMLREEKPETVVDEICRKVMAAIDCQMFLSYLVEEKSGRLELHSQGGIPAPVLEGMKSIAITETVCGYVVREKEPLIFNRSTIKEDPRTAVIRDIGVCAYACHPMIVAERSLGTLSFGSSTRSEFSPDELALMRTVADYVAIAIQRKLAEAELRSQTALLRGISENVTDLVYAKDLQSRITFANPATIEVIGKPESQIIGHSDADWTDNSEEARAIRENDLRLLREGKPVRLEERFNTRVFESAKAPLRDAAGSVIGLVGVSRDVTDRKAAEEQLITAKAAAEAASKAKDDFLAALSHELRTPLTPVLFLAGESIGDPSLDEDRRDDWRTVQKNISLQARLIDDLLDLTRIARGKFALERQTLDAHAIISDAVTMTRGNADAKQLKITVDLDARRRHVEGDAARLQQVFNNVLQNAVKFTPPGGSIFVQTRDDDRTGALIIEIADTGIGLTSEEVGRAFETFSQGDHATNRSTIFGGLGLGLSIAKEVLELHKGRISASSAGRNRGAIFAIELPTLAPNGHAANSAPLGDT